MKKQNSGPEVVVPIGIETQSPLDIKAVREAVKSTEGKVSFERLIATNESMRLLLGRAIGVAFNDYKDKVYGQFYETQRQITSLEHKFTKLLAKLDTVAISPKQKTPAPRKRARRHK
jgi:hypothetical protein